jgi:hypothetical protein
MYVELHRWDEAFDLIKERPEFAKDSYYVAFAEWLAINDRFDEAQAAFAKGGKPEVIYMFNSIKFYVFVCSAPSKCSSN